MFYYFRRDRERERERGGGQYCPQGDSKSKKTFFVKKTVSVLDDFTTLNSQGMGVIKLNSVLCFRFSFLSVCVGHCTGPIQWMNDCLCPTKFFQFCWNLDFLKKVFYIHVLHLNSFPFRIFYFESLPTEAAVVSRYLVLWNPSPVLF